jgi:hypothetical protein
MMPPSTVKAGPYRYRVVVDKAAIDAERTATRKAAAQGSCNADTQVITLDPGLAPDTLAETLLHEVFHAIYTTVGIGSEEKIQAHEMIYRTTPTLLDVLRSNPDLVAFLCHSDGGAT